MRKKVLKLNKKLPKSQPFDPFDAIEGDVKEVKTVKLAVMISGESLEVPKATLHDKLMPGFKGNYAKYNELLSSEGAYPITERHFNRLLLRYKTKK